MKTKRFQTLILGLTILSIVACQPKSPEIKTEVAVVATDSIVKPEEKKSSEDTAKAVELDTIYGFDVSHFQGKVDWATIKKSGKHFGIAKATQGITYTDPEFQTNWSEIEGNGMYRGAYHFYVAKDDPIKQAEHFVNTVKDMGAHHLPPALDLEGQSIEGLTVEAYQEGVMKWLNYVEEKLGIKPMIYTNHPFGNQYLNNDQFSTYQLWIAEYGSEEAKIPEAWTNKSWTGWQFTEHDKTEGLNGSVDESRFLSSILLNSKESESK
ncbi:MAG: hypothetical protein JKY48_18200 [Flavobacteriales bacterium]|nr:hypothetical protein [Flavobacteriales bacterium]